MTTDHPSWRQVKADYLSDPVVRSSYFRIKARRGPWRLLADPALILGTLIWLFRGRPPRRRRHSQ